VFKKKKNNFYFSKYLFFKRSVLVPLQVAVEREQLGRPRNLDMPVSVHVPSYSYRPTTYHIAGISP